MSVSTLQLKVNRITQEALDIRSFELVDPQGRLLPMFTAGAHLDVEMAAGLIRQYSISSDPRDVDRYVVGVLREPESTGGSVYMHEQIKEGDLLTIHGPRNNFPLSDNARHHILLAGGIGVTPMMAMARELHSRGASFELQYCTRSPERTAFRSEIANGGFSDRVTFHHDNGNPADGLDIIALLRNVRPDTHVYYCGPAGFMNVCRDATQHWPRGTTHFEYFTADLSVDHGEARTFRVKIASTGETYDIAEDRTILEVLRDDAGLDLDSMCEEGVCGTCATVVLDGEPDHRDFVLDDQERERNEFIMICCSRSKSPLLTLDL